MANKFMNSELLDEAIIFAVKAHHNTERNGKGFPYIVHPMEAVEIVATISSDQELLAAAILHDTIEDTPVTVEDLREKFGDRVAQLVVEESDAEVEGNSKGETWHMRKQIAIDHLAAACKDAKIVAMGDKLSNMRAIARDYDAKGDGLWKIFHVHDKKEHEWHYRGLANSLSDLKDTLAYQEFVSLIDHVFGKKEEYEKINLDDYILAGGGANGDSYNYKYDENVMLKLNNAGADISRVKREIDVARKAYEAGIATPEPGDIVTDGERYGLRFRRIVGKVSYARACGNHPEKAEGYGKEFAQLCKQLHATHLDTCKFTSQKTYYLDMLKDNPFYTEENKTKIAAFINEVPDADTANHGDLQFGNAIFTDTEKYFIDMENFCYGHPYFDLGMVCLVCCYDDEEFLKEAFHMDKPTALKFWKGFVAEYFDGKLSTDEAEELLKPYAALKNLLIERDAKAMVPTLHQIIEDSLLK